MQRARPKWLFIFLFATILPAFVLFLKAISKQGQKNREAREKIEQQDAEMEKAFKEGRLKDHPDGTPNAFRLLMEGKK